MRIVLSLVTILTYIFSVGCQANSVTSESIASPVSPPAQGDITQMPSSIPLPDDAGLHNLIEKAKADLSNRLAVSTNEISLIEATSVTWPDSSLGCPQEGMMYTQVLTPGYLILLEQGGYTFEYHAGRRDTIVTCDNPSPPVPGSPGNT
jgi:hypothetical protein